MRFLKTAFWGLVALALVTVGLANRGVVTLRVLPEDLDGKLVSGSLEQSNVNLTQALVDMIENQRSYEVQASLLKEAKTMDESAASLMRMPA